MNEKDLKIVREKCEDRLEKRNRNVEMWKRTFPNLLTILILVLHWYFLLVVEKEYYDDTNPFGIPYDYLIIWTPIFFISISFEALYSYLFNLGLYRFNDAIASLLLGTFSTLFKACLSRFALMSLYTYVYRHFVIYAMPEGWFSWWAMLLLVEFCYYWVHRTGHTMNIFWAMHGVHHGAEDYNLCTALRQSAFHQFSNQFYYLPCALFFSPRLFMLHSQFNLLYQYWIHTAIVPPLGPLEYVLNTPSQHRVHHGRNAYCIDKNYGGTLCIFDRLFDTFQEEIPEIPIVYGLTHSLNSFEIIDGNMFKMKHIIQQVWQFSSWKEKFYSIYLGPGWIPHEAPDVEYPIPPANLATCHPVDVQSSLQVKGYVFLHFLLVTVFLSEILLRNIPSTYQWTFFYLALHATLSLSNFGSILNHAAFLAYLEPLRLLLIPLSTYITLSTFSPTLWDDPMLLTSVGFTGISLLYWFWISSEVTHPPPAREWGFDLPNVAEEEAKDLKRAELARKGVKMM